MNEVILDVKSMTLEELQRNLNSCSKAISQIKNELITRRANEICDLETRLNDLFKECAKKGYRISLLKVDSTTGEEQDGIVWYSDELLSEEYVIEIIDDDPSLD